jgi:hypothetical protein
MRSRIGQAFSKISTTRFQIGALVLNLVLTLVIGAQSLHAVFLKTEYPAVKGWPDAAALADAGPPAAPASGLVDRAERVARGLEARTPASAVRAKPPIGGAAPPAEAEAGPLGDHWALGMSLLTDDPEERFCVLERKDADPGPGGKPRIPLHRGPAASPPAPARAAKKVLKVNDRWTDAEQGIDVRILEVARDGVRYEDLRDGRRAIYTLGRKPRAPEFWQEVPR